MPVKGIIVFFNFSPWSLIVSELLEGSIGGGLLSISAQLFACIADLTQKSPNEIVVISNENMDSVTQAKRLVKKRWFLFTLLDGVITCGMAFANALTGNNLTYVKSVLIFTKYFVSSGSFIID